MALHCIVLLLLLQGLKFIWLSILAVFFQRHFGAELLIALHFREERFSPRVSGSTDHIVGFMECVEDGLFSSFALTPVLNTCSYELKP